MASAWANSISSSRGIDDPSGMRFHSHQSASDCNEGYHRILRDHTGRHPHRIQQDSTLSKLGDLAAIARLTSSPCGRLPGRRSRLTRTSSGRGPTVRDRPSIRSARTKLGRRLRNCSNPNTSSNSLPVAPDRPECACRGLAEGSDPTPQDPNPIAEPVAQPIAGPPETTVGATVRAISRAILRAILRSNPLVTPSRIVSEPPFPARRGRRPIDLSRALKAARQKTRNAHQKGRSRVELGRRPVTGADRQSDRGDPRAPDPAQDTAFGSAETTPPGPHLRASASTSSPSTQPRASLPPSSSRSLARPRLSALFTVPRGASSWIAISRRLNPCR